MTELIQPPQPAPLNETDMERWNRLLKQLNDAKLALADHVMTAEDRERMLRARVQQAQQLVEEFGATIARERGLTEVSIHADGTVEGP
jgi:hypothetical protein